MGDIETCTLVITNTATLKEKQIVVLWLAGQPQSVYAEGRGWLFTPLFHSIIFDVRTGLN
jgi:hypothetical protein